MGDSDTMRKIMFRGRRRRIDGGDFIYGDLTYSEYEEGTKPQIGCWIVEPETVGQFIGLYDINKEEIYEGDIISQKNFNGEEYTAIYEVVFDGGGFCMKMLKGNKKAMEDGEHLSSFGYINHDNSLWKGEVIGNIHDNLKTFLEGGAIC